MSSGCITCLREVKRVWIIGQGPPSKRKRVEKNSETSSTCTSSPNPLNKYLEAAHYPSDCRRYQNLYPHQYAKHVKGVKEAYADLNRCLKRRGQREKRGAVTSWSIHHADKLFPNICERHHCVPPVFVNAYGLKEDPHCSKKIGVPVFTTRVSESDVRGSNSHRQVMCAFQRLNVDLEKRELPCMFLVSDYSYDNYLRWVRDPRHLRHEHCDWFRRLELDASLEASSRRDRNDSEPCIGFPEDAGVQRHKTDLIVFHETKGLLTVQIKSIGGQETPREIMKRKIEECITRQLRVDTEMFCALLRQDRAPSVTRVLALPNVTAEELSTLPLNKNLTNGISFLLKDHLFEANTGIPESQTDIMKFLRWWQGLPDRPASLDLIKDLVGRYVGILSTPIDLLEVNERSRVRDYCDVILFVGRLFKRLVLTEQQVSALRTQETSKTVYLSGPPGSGKTLLLIMRARMFLENFASNHVVVLNLYRGAKGRAIGAFIAQALRSRHVTSGRSNLSLEQRIHHVRLDINDVDKGDGVAKAVSKELPKGLPTENVMFVIDEIFTGKCWRTVWASLSTSFKDSTVWCAGLAEVLPEASRVCQTISLDLVLRCPPAVQNVLHRTDWDDKRRALYTGDSNRPELASNGPAPLCVRHERHQVGVSVRDCSQCAVELASLLQDTLRLVQRPETHETSPGNGSRSDQSPALLPCDVVVLYNVPRQEFRKTDRDSTLGEVELTSTRFQLHAQEMSSCKFFDTLKDELKIASLRLVDRLDDRGLEGSGSSKEILVSWVDIVQGLEKEVVIFLPGDASPKSVDSSSDRKEAKAKPFQMSMGAELISEEKLEPWGFSEMPLSKGNETGTWKFKLEVQSTGSSKARLFHDIALLEECIKDTGKCLTDDDIFRNGHKPGARHDTRTKSSPAIFTETISKMITLPKVTQLRRSFSLVIRDFSDKARQPTLFSTSGVTIEESSSDSKRGIRELPVPGLSRDQFIENGLELIRTGDNAALFAANEVRKRGKSKSGEERGDLKRTARAPGLPEMLWRSEDIDRYSDWDQTNLFLAASRCCAQLIMIVP